MTRKEKTLVSPSMLSEIEIESEDSVDAIDEIRLRTWARQHYAPANERDDEWHPVILDEMTRKDREIAKT